MLRGAWFLTIVATVLAVYIPLFLDLVKLPLVPDELQRVVILMVRLFSLFGTCVLSL